MLKHVLITTRFNNKYILFKVYTFIIINLLIREITFSIQSYTIFKIAIEKNSDNKYLYFFAKIKRNI